MRVNNKKRLYRKVNTKARGVQHVHGSDYRKTRRCESAVGMRKGVLRGLDYTPLFRFLLSKVGQSWDVVYSEAVSRLDKEEPIYWIVSHYLESSNEYVLIGESTYYSGLYVDTHNILRVVNPELNEDSMAPACRCCTHTFNGIVFTKRYAL